MRPITVVFRTDGGPLFQQRVREAGGEILSLLGHGCLEGRLSSDVF